MADHDSDFMCACDQDGKKRCEELLARVYKALDCDASNLLTKVVYDLQHGLYSGQDKPYYTANITSIVCDMWAAVSVEVEKYDHLEEEFKHHEKVYVQCDQIEHGVARAWELVREMTKAE